MMHTGRGQLAWIVALVVVGSAMLGAAKIKVRAEGDKTFDFTLSGRGIGTTQRQEKSSWLAPPMTTPRPCGNVSSRPSWMPSRPRCRREASSGATGGTPDLKVTYYLIVKLTAGRRSSGNSFPRRLLGPAPVCAGDDILQGGAGGITHSRLGGADERRGRVARDRRDGSRSVEDGRRTKGPPARGRADAASEVSAQKMIASARQRCVG